MKTSPVLPTETEFEFLDSFAGIDAAMVGSLIGEGGDHRVYEYGVDEVIKVPQDHLICMRDPEYAYSAEQRQSVLDTLYDYFPRQVLPTTVVANPDDGYVMLQQKMTNFSNLNPDNLETVKTEFSDVVSSSTRLLREQGKFLDFLGRQGVAACMRSYYRRNTLPELSNVVLDNQTGSIKITDIDVIDVAPTSINSGALPLFYSMMSKGIFKLNIAMLRNRFDADLSELDNSVASNYPLPTPDQTIA